jgi:hypothetical protein
VCVGVCVCVCVCEVDIIGAYESGTTAHRKQHRCTNPSVGAFLNDLNHITLQEEQRAFVSAATLIGMYCSSSSRHGVRTHSKSEGKKKTTQQTQTLRDVQRAE